MLEVIFEFITYVFCEALAMGTGHGLVYAVTLGKGRCSDEIATAIGIVFWLIVVIVLVVLMVR